MTSPDIITGIVIGDISQNTDYKTATTRRRQGYKRYHMFSHHKERYESYPEPTFLSLTWYIELKGHSLITCMVSLNNQLVGNNLTKVNIPCDSL